MDRVRYRGDCRGGPHGAERPLIWLAIGILLGGLPLFYSAFLSPEPDSLWARRASRRHPAA